MKKNGFTLAEILITIGVIGVLAAVTIPTFVQNNQNKVFANSLASAASNFENAMSAMIVREDVGRMFETEAWSVEGKFEEKVREILRISSYTSDTDNYYDENLKSIANNTEFKPSTAFGSTSTFEAKTGAAYHIKTTKEADEKISDIDAMADGASLSKIAAWVFIDVNGKNEPNKIGRDIYGFLLGNDGIMYALGSRDAGYRIDSDVNKTWENSGSSYACTDSVKKNYALGCTGRLISEKYEIKF